MTTRMMMCAGWDLVSCGSRWLLKIRRADRPYAAIASICDLCSCNHGPRRGAAVRRGPCRIADCFVVCHLHRCCTIRFGCWILWSSYVFDWSVAGWSCTLCCSSLARRWLLSWMWTRGSTMMLEIGRPWFLFFSSHVPWYLSSCCSQEFGLCHRIVADGGRTARLCRAHRADALTSIRFHSRSAVDNDVRLVGCSRSNGECGVDVRGVIEVVVDDDDG